MQQTYWHQVAKTAKLRFLLGWTLSWVEPDLCCRFAGQNCNLTNSSDEVRIPGFLYWTHSISSLIIIANERYATSCIVAWYSLNNMFISSQNSTNFVDFGFSVSFLRGQDTAQAYCSLMTHLHEATPWLKILEILCL